MKEKKKVRKPSLGIALLPLIFMIVVLVGGIIVFDISIEFLLLLSAAFATCICLYLGHSWKDIEDELVKKLATAFPAISILLAVGVMIGAWMTSGTIPYLVYIGLKIINPKFIIVTSFLVTVVLSVSTGTSWGAAGTVGAALMGVAAGMGAPLPAVAGAVVSGAYFGDKMSPLSDSTNLSAIAAGTNLYKHVGHMFYTTVPGFIICCIAYTIAGMHFAGSGSIDKVDEILNTLSQLYHLQMPYGLLLLLPPVVVIAGSLLKKPTIPVMFISSGIALAIALTLQGFSIQNCATSMVEGFSMDMFTNPSIDMNNILSDVPRLLERGGMSSMMGTIMMAFCAFGFVAALTVSGALDVVLPHIMDRVHSTGQLILTTVIAGVIMITATGNASVSFLLLGSIFHNEYIKRGLQAKNLSRTLEDSVTVVEPLVPWTLAGVYMATTLGVPTLEYAPWACLGYTGIIFAILWGFTGFGIAKIKKGSDNYDEYVELTGNSEVNP